MALFEELSRQGNTILVVTHEEEIARYARRVIRIRDGAIAGDEVIWAGKQAQNPGQNGTLVFKTSRRPARTQKRRMKLSRELAESVRISWAAIGENKLRAALTTLGIVIGVATVSLMGSAIAGLKRTFEESFVLDGH